MMNAQQIELAKLLKVELKNDGKDERRLNARMTGVGLFDWCSRCGGSGHYSFNQIDGTRCYGCGGRGKYASRITKKVVEAARELAASGKVDAYLVELAENARIEKLAKNAVDKMMAAWTASGVDKLYDWRKSADEARKGVVGYDREMSDINKLMCDAYQSVQNSVRALDAVRALAPETRELQEQKEQKLREATAAIAASVEAGLQEIERAKHMIPALLAKYGK